MMTEFEMSMFSEIKFFVGLQINQSKHGTFMWKRDIENMWNGGF